MSAVESRTRRVGREQVSDRGDAAERATRYVLAVDLGTGGPKVALVSVDGHVVGSEFEPVELLLLDGGGVEQRPADWWAAITTAAKRLLARGLVPSNEVVAIACTGQWSGTVAVDADGTPLMNAVIWMDTRGSRDVRRIVQGHGPSVGGYGLVKARKWIRATAGVPGQAGKDPIAHILFIKRERPDVYAATYKFLEPVDWLNQQLHRPVRRELRLDRDALGHRQPRRRATCATTTSCSAWRGSSAGTCRTSSRRRRWSAPSGPSSPPSSASAPACRS